jgi:NAD(P)-dependent dehydrogenase (short-subunit alcohol dehydrogenase family)
MHGDRAFRIVARAWSAVDHVAVTVHPRWSYGVAISGGVCWMTRTDAAAGRTGRLDGKVAIITGGASGMGRETALVFLDEGARVVIADLNATKAEETLALAAGKGHAEAIRFRRADVSEEEDIVATVSFALESFGRLDCVFNNAGVGGAVGPLTETSVQDWDRTQTMLLRSVFLGIKHGARAMLQQGSGGSIINTASTAGIVGGSGMPAYSAAKAGVVNLTQNAALELAPGRIRVNAIAPGGIMTPMVPATTDEEMRRFLKGRQPWPDTGRALDIAYAALFLASDESRFCTGITLRVDGGLLAAGPGLFPHASVHATSAGAFSMGNTRDEARKGALP